MRWLSIVALLVLALASGCGRGDEDGGVAAAVAEAVPRRRPGITDTSIKLGGSYPFSGPASAYASIALGAQARFKAENEKGGVDGRKIEFVTLDDAYEPQRAVTNARRLVEQDQVFAMFNTLGHAEQPGDLGLPEPEEGPARVRRHRRVGLGRGRPRAPVHDGLAARLRVRGQGLRGVPEDREAAARRSRCSTRTTASARTCWAGSRRRSRARTSRSSRRRATR